MGMRRWPGLSLPFALSLLILSGAVALGASAFLLADALVFRPILLPTFNSVVRLAGLATPTSFDKVQWWSQARSLEHLAHFEAGVVEIETQGTRRLEKAARVSPRFFEILDQTPTAGRLFADRDFSDDDVPPVVLTESLASALFGTAAEAVGSGVRISNIVHVVIGTVEKQLAYPADIGLVLPSRRAPGSSPTFVDAYRDEWIGRLAKGRTVQDAERELYGLLERLQTEDNKGNVRYGSIVSVVSLKSAIARPFRSPLLALLVGAGLVLVLAVSNVSTLLTTSTLDRRATFAIQIALGATPHRLLTALVQEVCLLGAVSGCLGGLCAYWMAGAILPIFEFQIGVSRVFHPEMWGLGTAATGAMIVGTSMGFVAGLPALMLAATWTDWHLVSARRKADGRRKGRRLRSGLTVTQVALAMALVVAAGVALLTFKEASAIDLGFSPDGLVATRATVTPERLTELVQSLQALDRSAVAVASSVPVAERAGYLYVGLGGRGVTAAYFDVSDDYFSVMGTRVLAGRTLSNDRSNVVVISESLAASLSPGQSPLGELVVIGGERTAREVVGIIADVREQRATEQVGRQFYLPQSNTYGGNVYDGPVATFVSRCQANCAPDHSVQKIIESAGGQLLWRQRMDDSLREVLAPVRLRAIAGLFYGSCGILLAIGGMYSLMSFAAAAAQHEVAVRMACGASPNQAAALLVARSFRVVAWGVVLGTAMVVPLLSLVRHLFFGVALSDPLILIGSAAILVAGAALASIGPALRTRRVNIRGELYRST